MKTGECERKAYWPALPQEGHNETLVNHIDEMLRGDLCPTLAAIRSDGG
jgi:hypothetical protein